MAWNYRVGKRKNHDGTVLFAIHEAYYDENGKPRAITENPTRPQGETFEEWMKALRPHYMEAHADIMNDPSHDHGQEKMDKWLADNKARFDAA